MFFVNSMKKGILELVELYCDLSPMESIQLDMVSKRKVTPREKQCVQALSDIYMAVHAFSAHTCKHSDWMEKANNDIKNLNR